MFSSFILSLKSRFRFPAKSKKDVGKKSRLKFTYSSLVALVILATGLFARYEDYWWIEMIRLRAFDTYNKLHPRQPQPNSPVVIVDIDEKSLAEIGQWPWSRIQIAELLRKMAEYKMALAGFDVLFAEEDRTSPTLLADQLQSGDWELISKLKQMPNNETVMADAMQTISTVLGQAVDKSLMLNEKELPKEAAKTSVLGFLGKAGVIDVNPNRYLFRQPALLYNLPVLEAKADGLGIFSVEDEIDGVVRRVPLVLNVNGIVKPTLALEMLRVAFGGNSIFTVVDIGGIDRVGLQTPQGNFPIPVDGRGRVWINYAKPDIFNSKNNEGRLYVSASDIMKNLVPKERLMGRIGLIGTSSVGLVDIRATAVSARQPGVEVHANLIENILERNHFDYPYTMTVIELIASFFVGCLLIVLLPLVRPFVTLITWLTSVAMLVGASLYLFTYKLLFLDITFGIGITSVIYAVMAYSNYARDAAEKRQVKTAFSQYLSPALVRQLADHPELLKLGGETKRMTLLFCDVRGFTTISESFKSDPQGLTRLINRLLTPLTNEILTRQGTIDKYMGDCIMAFWNAPLTDDEQELHAVQAALAMFDALDRLNSEREKEAEAANQLFIPLKVGIGINSGDVVVGNMGSDQRFDYSVLGDAVNLASRLEGQSKSYGVGVVLGESTAESLVNKFPLLELDKIAVKGKSEAVRIFTVVGSENVRANPDYRALFISHNEFLAAYRAQDWDKAKQAMQKGQNLLNGVMHDYYAIFAERIEEFLESPLPKDWDGVYIAKSK